MDQILRDGGRGAPVRITMAACPEGPPTSLWGGGEALCPKEPRRPLPL